LRGSWFRPTCNRARLARFARFAGLAPGAEACRQVGELARPVWRVAEEFGVCWWTIMNTCLAVERDVGESREVHTIS
jgi:hypothetical protein